MSQINPITLAPIVTNTDPARLIGREPITGQHVRLECLAQSHFSDLYDNIGPSHPDLWTWWPEDAPSTPSKFDEYMDEFSKFQVPDLAVYAVILLSGPNNGKAAGLGMAMSKDRDSKRIGEVGLFLGPLLQRSRAGTEVPYILTNLLFDLNHRRVGWNTNSLNNQSRKAAERYGFVFEGTFRQDQIDKGRNRDSSWYSIIDSEWPVCKEAFEKWLDDGNFDEQQQQKRRLEEIRESLLKP